MAALLGAFYPTLGKEGFHAKGSQPLGSLRPVEIAQGRGNRKYEFLSKLSPENGSPKSLVRKGDRKREKRSTARSERAKWLISVNLSDGNWASSWHTEQTTTLTDLNLQDFALEGFQGDGKPRRDLVLVELRVQKMSLGFYVEGRVLASALRKCDCCFASYSRAVDAEFDLMLAPRGALQDSDDPSVLHFSPNRDQADITEAVRDVIQLNQSTKAFCSEICKNQGARSWESLTPLDSVVDSTWLPLLQARAKFDGDPS